MVIQFKGKSGRWLRSVLLRWEDAVIVADVFNCPYRQVDETGLVVREYHP